MFYSLAITVLHWGYNALSLINTKARKRTIGIAHFNIPDKIKKRVWVHCASAGEYEQALPLIRQLNANLEIETLVTFFSPSGMEHAQTHPEADFYCYLPFDHQKEAVAFVDLIDADVVVWVKYEFWKNILTAIKIKGLPLYLINADLHYLEQKSGFYASIIRSCLRLFDEIYAVSEGFKEHTHVHMIADSKWQQAKNNTLYQWQHPDLHQFAESGNVIVCGSIHMADLKILQLLVKDQNLDCKWLVVPHETDTKTIKKLMSILPHDRTSLLSEGVHPNATTVVVNQYGILKYLYRYADVAFVGGGFEKSVHNVLEPAAYGIPVVCGPKINGIPEAIILCENKILHLANSPEAISLIISRVLSEKKVDFKEKSTALFEDRIRNGFTRELSEKISAHLSQE
jgi:3-deoxy-D-manno-octulosonic-acid transferase